MGPPRGSRRCHGSKVVTRVQAARVGVSHSGFGLPGVTSHLGGLADSHVAVNREEAVS